MTRKDKPTAADDAVLEDGDLHRGLHERHIQLIALGGVLGVGLFLGSGSAIHDAGPALLLTYAVAGAVVFIILRALGELVLYKPVSGSFAVYAKEFLGDFAGFFTAWTYWLFWVLICIAEVTATGLYMHYWFPGLPQWVTAFVALVLLTMVNLVAVGAFGEFEFWFALLKILTIIGLIILGLALVLVPTLSSSSSAHFSNLWEHGGFFAQGIKGPFLALAAVVFSFAGVEMIGATAGEARNPSKVMPSAINKVIWRILIFYIGSLFVIMCVFPWTKATSGESPFVMVFAQAGIGIAAGFMNVVVVTAALSSCNSGIYTTGRMIYTLSHQGHAPARLGRVSKSGAPQAAVLFSFVAAAFAVVLNLLVPEEAFSYILGMVTAGALFIWTIILLCHWRYRLKIKAGELREGEFRMPGFPAANVVALAFLALVVVLMATQPATRIPLYVAPVWFVLVYLGYRIQMRYRNDDALVAAMPTDASGATQGK